MLKQLAAYHPLQVVANQKASDQSTGSQKVYREVAFISTPVSHYATTFMDHGCRPWMSQLMSLLCLMQRRLSLQNSSLNFTSDPGITSAIYYLKCTRYSATSSSAVTSIPEAFELQFV